MNPFVAPRLSSQSLKISPEFLRSKLARMGLVFTLLFSALALPALGQNLPNPSSSAAITRIHWIPQRGVRRYRLQIASDEQFHDVMFDGVVSGHEYVPRDLMPGRYHWRVASAESRSQRFLGVGQLEVKTEEAQPRLAVSRSSSSATLPGWMVTTGEVSFPMTAQLRTGRDLDFLATNSAGTVYALDSARGTALWIARYTLATKPARSGIRQFVPLVLDTANNITLVMVLFEKGLRALEGLSGREVWQVAVPENLVGGIAASLDDKPGPEIYLTEDRTDKLLRLDAQTGRVESEIRLTGRPVGPPVPLSTKAFRGLLVPLQGNVIEVRNGDGEHLQSIRLGADLTTPPVTVETSRGVLMIVGTKDGLIAFEMTGFQPIGRTSIAGGHYPEGSLAIVDLDGDKSSDRVILITNLGRIVAVNLSDGSVNWFADGFSSAASIAFGDLNGDGLLDVMVPDSKNFAVGLSGDTGARIWEGPEAGRGSGSTEWPAPVKKLSAATLKDGRIIVVGNDPTASGLRALELRKGSATAAKN
ncbi:MAG: PQQ-binding-like beta-propeller repeat protein [Pyrinomonadaceae bacterium]|nr:PQQ-binding-like beta-propeller repeat protein [Pyrinomonadaceae bacterium]